MKTYTILLKNMAGFDEKDSTSARKEVPDFEKVLGQDIKGLKVGIPADLEMPAPVNATIFIFILLIFHKNYNCIL